MPEWGNEIIKLEAVTTAAAATPCVIRGREATRTNVPDVRTQLIITWFEVFAILDSIRISVFCHLNSNPGEQWGNVSHASGDTAAAHETYDVVTASLVSLSLPSASEGICLLWFPFRFFSFSCGGKWPVI